MSLTAQHVERDITEEERRHLAQLEKVREGIRKMPKKRLLKIVGVLRKYLVDQRPGWLPDKRSAWAWIQLYKLEDAPRQ